MSVVQALADVLEQTVSNPELCGAGVEIPTLHVKIREIELPSQGFRRALRRPVTLRIRHESQYWLVSDFQTTVWGTAPTIGEAILDYMREWKEQLDWLATRREEMGHGLIADYEKALRLVA
ncbi:MAG: hypothetical protein NTZ05_03465 [Chloroflexi bacterium]|nr:hypothetical protein [Chloroflexota bacterium]